MAWLVIPSRPELNMGYDVMYAQTFLNHQSDSDGKPLIHILILLQLENTELLILILVCEKDVGLAWLSVKALVGLRV